MPQSLHSKCELWGHRLQVAADVDTSHAALEERRVEHLEGCAKVVSIVLVLELRHILTTRGDGKLGLGNELVGPSEVESSGERTLIVYVALAEYL